MPKISQLDQQYVWHPYTQHALEQEPLAVVRGEGSKIYLEDGSSLIDGISSWWVNLHGHAHPHITARLNQQLLELHHVIFAGFTHRPAVELAEKLLHRLPGNQAKIFFSDNGSTAVEVAVKMAVQACLNRGRAARKVVAFSNSYHGDTFGAMSLSARGGFFRPYEEMLLETRFLPAPSNSSGEESAEALEEALCQGDVAAFIFEPLVQGAGGMKFYSADLLNTLLSICRKHAVFTIADEVFTGFGRTGKLFACEYLKESPDIITLSKGISGGTLPLGATSCTEEIFGCFLSDERARMLVHGHSYTANPLACAAALASLELLELEETKKSIVRIAETQNRLRDELAEAPDFTDARVLGTIFACELLQKGESGSYYSSLRDKLYRFFLSRGVLLRPLGNTVYCVPPYCTTEEELLQIHSAIRDAAQALKEL
ncbi:MAG: adenosylmethionine--8-amino-7-oxononanoate transaminase [Deltaproteobacteria bacterium]|nr:adenosylmethionine--8-amino-7-oxononanoate transaminase [Deltaproteobacteria bacterium]